MAVTGADVVEDLKGGAEARRNLTGNNLFCNLGEPIQNIILALEEDGKETDDRTMKLLSHITVKQLAKIFDMLGQGEEAETILAWLKRRARKNKKKGDPDADALKEKIQTNAARDPIAYFKELERANQEQIRENQEKQEERDILRAAKTKEREQKRDAAAEQAAEAKKAMEEDGQVWKPEENLAPKERAAINNAFEKFAGDNSAFDNSDKDQDGEWWKKD
eukprot:gene55736-34226_t